MKKKLLSAAVALTLLTTLVGLTQTTVKAEENNKEPVVIMPSGSALEQNDADPDFLDNYIGEDEGIAPVQSAQNTISPLRTMVGGFKTKKGLQGANPYDTVYKDLGVTQTLVNCNILNIIGTKGDCYVEYRYNGKTYYFNYIDGLSTETHDYNAAGMDITVVLLLPYESEHANMIYEGARKSGHNYYAWNLDDSETRELYDAMFHFLGETYSREAEGWNQCYVKNWVIGNEVNMPNSWNYTGTRDLNTNVELCARQFKFVNDILKSYNTNMKTYISIEHSWTHDDEGRGIAGKTFIDNFARRINEMQPGIDWNIAYHAYPAIMTNSNIWSNNSYTTKDINTDFISGYNLEVLTDYVKNNFGSDVRIILSEQGFTVSGGQQAKQAAALAYTYYKAEFNDMIDAVIFRSLRDDPAEAAQNFKFGLLNDDGSKRPSYDVFKYMDTTQWEGYAASCLGTMGIGSWYDVIPGFYPAKFAEEPVDEVTYNVRKFVNRLYNNVLDRGSDADGMAVWVDYILAGNTTGVDVGYHFVFSQECRGRNLSDEDFIDMLYLTFMNRKADTSGRNAWLSYLNAGIDREKVFEGFANSSEYAGICSSYGIELGNLSANGDMIAINSRYRNRNANLTKFVARCYVQGLGRNYDVDGLEAWCEFLYNGVYTPKATAQFFITSQELTNRNLSDGEYVEVLYRMFMGREPDASGYEAWINALANGSHNRQTAMEGFADSIEFSKIIASFGL